MNKKKENKNIRNCITCFCHRQLHIELAYNQFIFILAGFVSVFAASLLGTVLGALFMVVRVSSFHWTPKKPENNRNTFSPMHVWDCLRTTFKPRAGPNRKYILLFMMTILFTIVPYVGEYLVDYFYVRQKFQWEVTEYSTYTAVVSSAGIIGKDTNSVN